MRLDESIHRLIWDGSHNPYLIETLERYFAALAARLVRRPRPRARGSAPRSSTRRTCSRPSSIATRARARSLMREHVLAFEREIMAAFSHED